MYFSSIKSSFYVRQFLLTWVSRQLMCTCLDFKPVTLYMTEVSPVAICLAVVNPVTTYLTGATPVTICSLWVTTLQRLLVCFSTFGVLVLLKSRFSKVALCVCLGCITELSVGGKLFNYSVALNHVLFLLALNKFYFMCWWKKTFASFQLYSRKKSTNKHRYQILLSVFIGKLFKFKYYTYHRNALRINLTSCVVFWYEPSRVNLIMVELSKRKQGILFCPCIK